jgi:Mlc titration factor MtfA (ptsG expression regulator)
MYIVLFIAFLLIVAYVLFRVKNPPVKQVPVMDYRDLLAKHVAYYAGLDRASKDRFAEKVSEFLRETRIEGVGTEITGLDRVLIASSAVIPIFGFPGWKYRNLTNVILYPDTFDAAFRFEGENRNILGMVGSGYMNGQMLLSRAALTKGFSGHAGVENAAIHEFVHLLDQSDGATDGVPENLLARQYVLPWLHLMHQEMHRIKSGESEINPYALTNEAEFFAVASEYFFEKPEQLQLKHPELYAGLQRIFSQEPAARKP